MHQTVRNILRTLVHGNLPQGTHQSNDSFYETLAVAQHTMHCGAHTTLGNSPGALVFHQDMFLHISLLDNWCLIRKHREHLVNENLRQVNLKCQRYDYTMDKKCQRKLMPLQNWGRYSLVIMKLKSTCEWSCAKTQPNPSI